MKRTRSFLATLACLFTCVAHAGAREDAAQAAALKWLAVVDAEQYALSWEQAAQLFKRQVSVTQWTAAVSGVRPPLGEVRSRTLKTATYMESLPGAPDGQYVVLQFKTEFEHKADAVETVTPMFDEGVWRVSGYYVR